MAGIPRLAGMLHDTRSMIENNPPNREADVWGYQIGTLGGAIVADVVNDPVGGTIGLFGVKAPRRAGTVGRIYDDTSFLRAPEPHYRND